MLAHRLRRWPNIEPTLAARPVFAEIGEVTDLSGFIHGVRKVRPRHIFQFEKKH